MEKKYEGLVALDLEGVLVAEDATKILLGLVARRNPEAIELMQREKTARASIIAAAGGSKPDYAALYASSARLFADCGVKRTDFKAAAEKATPMTGASVFLRWAEGRNLALVLVTASSADLAEQICAHHFGGHTFFRILGTRFKFSDGEVTIADRDSFVLPGEKRSWVQATARVLNIPRDRVIAIGNTPGDEGMQVDGKLIGFNPKGEFGCDKIVQGESLIDVVPAMQEFMAAWS